MNWRLFCTLSFPIHSNGLNLLSPSLSSSLFLSLFSTIISQAYSCSIYYSPDRTPPEENPDLEVQEKGTKILSDRIGQKSDETSSITATATPVVLKSDQKHQIRTRTSSSIGNDEMIVVSPSAHSASSSSPSYSFSHRHGNGSGPVVSVKNLISRFSDSKETTATGGTESSNKNQLNCPPVSGGEILPTESCANPDDRRNRTDTLTELPLSTLNGAGIRPRLITDKYPFEVPFTICCWPGQEEISSSSPSTSSSSSSCSSNKNFSNTEISICSSDDNRPRSSSNVRKFAWDIIISFLYFHSIFTSQVFLHTYTHLNITPYHIPQSI